MPLPPNRLQILCAAAGLLLACGSLACLGGSPRPGLETGPAPHRPQPPPSPPLRELPSVVSHTVRAGETLWRISRAYGADLEELMAVNALHESALIQAGQVLVIPAPTRLPSAARSSTMLRWPLRGSIRSGFGPRGKRHHDGIDIDGQKGDPIRAAADGEVAMARSWGAYGKTVVLDHGGGVHTLYAHASRVLVNAGEQVRAGQTIAEVGRSGNATGTHLHFELQRNGKPIDPMKHLPPKTTRTATAH